MNKIGLLGYGVVGKGVFSLVEQIKDKYDLEITKILERPSKKDIIGDKLVTNYQDICLDNQISIVIECLGGDDISYKAIKLALENKKSVITSNKETVCLHLDEYLSIAKKNNVFFLFEASVGGGIPLIHTMLEILKFDHINSFRGILNGTTNYIITKMFDDNISFNEALRLAQEKGFAEKDPTNDIEGLDMVRKGIILSSLCYNVIIDIDSIEHYGISNLSLDIVNDIKKMNKVLKMVVDSSFNNNQLSLSIIPCLLNKDDSLDSIKNEFNGVCLNAINNGDITLIGKGAGKFPTASAIMQDLMLVLGNKGNIIRDNPKKILNQINRNFYYYIVDKNKESKVVYNPSDEELSNSLFIAKIV